MAGDSISRAALVKKGVRIAGTVLAALWIGLGTAFFLVRFSTAFYNENTAAIQRLLDLVPWR